MLALKNILCVFALVALPSFPALACSPPLPGSSYALEIERLKSEHRRSADIVAEGSWHYTRNALLADKRMDARLAAEPPGGTKIKNFQMSFAAVIPTKVTRGKAKKSYKVWYSRLNQTCPSDGPPEGAQGIFYLKRTKINNRSVLWLEVFDKASLQTPQNDQEPPK